MAVIVIMPMCLRHFPLPSPRHSTHRLTLHPSAALSQDLFLLRRCCLASRCPCLPAPASLSDVKCSRGSHFPVWSSSPESTSVLGEVYEVTRPPQV
ncbi:hypothetical protein E2C01_062266 [Portunus trituberculatus]|uniref:Uncharacterized protein n=1 Tax=Portunus trituberculatus TaxID=210409 RepID=A0A5B7HHJ5_PORTR|nr:hypothetical protein [Portunus trituberculatus]